MDRREFLGQLARGMAVLLGARALSEEPPQLMVPGPNGELGTPVSDTWFDGVLDVYHFTPLTPEQEREVHAFLLKYYGL